MRTKALLGLAVLAAGLATSVAQNVYSLNVVGYYNVAVPANQQIMIANQLNTTNNTLKALLPVAPDGTQIFKYSGGYSSFTYDEIDGAWLPNGDATLNPGEGAFIKSPVATTLTFVGEVLQGNLTNTTPIGVQVIRSSMVPQAGAITTVLGLEGEDGDQVFKYAGGFNSFTYDEIDANWLPSQPSVNVGEAFFLKKSAGATKTQWIRNFTVN